MARGIARGDIWLLEFRPPDKRRPVVVLTREGVLPFLRWVTVAPITTTIRDLPTEVRLGIGNGLKVPSVVNLDQVQTVEKDRLHQWLGQLDTSTMRDVCAALATALGCDVTETP
jgi:mRNA interferase MazF